VGSSSVICADKREKRGADNATDPGKSSMSKS